MYLLIHSTKALAGVAIHQPGMKRNGPRILL